MRILLLGKNGQVGWELQQTLSPVGELIAVDYPEIDLADGENLIRYVRQIRPDGIVNAAANTNVDKSEIEADNAFAVNAIAPGLLAALAKEIGAFLIHYSTDYVFDGNKGSAYTEDDIPNPINMYGKSKLLGEQKIQNVDMPFLIFRTSWVYGMRSPSFVTKVIDWAQHNKSLRIVSDQIGNPTWCRSLAQLTAQVLNMASKQDGGWWMDHRGIYHIAGAGIASRFEFARKILALVPKKYPILAEQISPAFTADFNDLAKRPLFSALDTSKFVNSFGINLPPWEDSLKLALADYFQDY